METSQTKIREEKEIISILFPPSLSSRSFAFLLLCTVLVCVSLQLSGCCMVVCVHLSPARAASAVEAVVEARRRNAVKRVCDSSWSWQLSCNLVELVVALAFGTDARSVPPPQAASAANSPWNSALLFYSEPLSSSLSSRSTVLPVSCPRSAAQ